MKHPRVSLKAVTDLVDDLLTFYMLRLFGHRVDVLGDNWHRIGALCGQGVRKILSILFVNIDPFEIELLKCSRLLLVLNVLVVLISVIEIALIVLFAIVVFLSCFVGPGLCPCFFLD